MRREYDPAYYSAEHPGNRWLFRAVFEFSDGRPAWRGGWFPATRYEDTAKSVDKRNLLFAYIEGKHFTSKEVRQFQSVPGPEFLDFQHMGVTISNDKSTVNHVYGMKIIAKGYNLIALEDGSTRYEQK